MSRRSLVRRPKLFLALAGGAYVLLKKATRRKSSRSSGARTQSDTAPAQQPLRGEDLAEEASMDSFPASDPPSY